MMQPEKPKHRFVSMTIYLPPLEHSGMLVQKKVKFPANTSRILSLRAFMHLKGKDNWEALDSAVKEALETKSAAIATAVITTLEKVKKAAILAEKVIAEGLAAEMADLEPENYSAAVADLEMANEAYLIADAADKVAIAAIETADIALKVSSEAKYGYAVAISGKFITHRSTFFHTAVQHRDIEIMKPYLDCSALWTRLDFDIPKNKNANLIAEGIGEIGKTLNTQIVKIVFLLEING